MEEHPTNSVIEMPKPTLPLEQKKTMYVESLNEREMRALAIAQDHLRHSFVMEKSIGFKQFCARLEKEA
jgi:hypothetical protein